MDVYDKILYQDEDKQFRLTINEFREVDYLHIRKYYMSFDGEWQPTKEGFAIPMGIGTSLALFEAVIEILSLTESKYVLAEKFVDLYRQLYPDEL